MDGIVVKIQITKAPDEESLRIQSAKDGTQNLRESGLSKVKLGLTSIEEVLSSTTDEWSCGWIDAFNLVIPGIW